MLCNSPSQHSILKAMVTQVVFNVKSDNRVIGAPPVVVVVIVVGAKCPQCGKGTILKGNAAYGCSEWKMGIGWILSDV